MTLIALLRPAHLPQSASKQSCSVRRTSLTISGSIWCLLGFARARHTLAVTSPTFVLSEVHKFSKEVLVVFAAFKKAPSSVGRSVFAVFTEAKASRSCIIITIEVVFCGTSINRD